MCIRDRLLGALALLPAFCRDYGLRGVWMSVFHSVSAFCNAGFDILGRADALYPSLTAYAADPLVNIVIMLLIIVGGIGFLTWDDVCTHGLHLRRYRMPVSYTHLDVYKRQSESSSRLNRYSGSIDALQMPFCCKYR